MCSACLLLQRRKDHLDPQTKVLLIAIVATAEDFYTAIPLLSLQWLLDTFILAQTGSIGSDHFYSSVCSCFGG